MKLNILVCVLLFLSLNLFAQKKGDKSFYERGVAKINKEDYTGALAELNKAILVHPNHAEAYAKRAYAKANLQDHEGALQDYDKSIEIDPGYAQTYSNRGIARLNLRDKEGACKDWQKAFNLGFKEANDYLLDFCQ